MIKYSFFSNIVKLDFLSDGEIHLLKTICKNFLYVKNITQCLGLKLLAQNL
jgi:hypothetical protein